MENENLIGVYLKLLGVLECPVCLEYLTKPVALCKEGHAVCSKCKSSVSCCPMCRNEIGGTRGVIIDQVIETLLYPCYKMGCGSLLKRTDAENHEINCILEITADKQTVLHNNLLKNIEENFASFIVQPEIVKETRTVGTVTGKIKTVDARVQTAIPFSSKIQTTVEALKSSEVLGSSSFFGNQPKAGPSAGISISSSDDFQLPVGLNNSKIDLKNRIKDFNINLNSQQSSGFKFNVDDFQNVSFSNGANSLNQMSQPFLFSAGNKQIREDSSRSSPKKPSTNLYSEIVKINNPEKPEKAISALAPSDTVNVSVPTTSSSSIVTVNPASSQNEVVHPTSVLESNLDELSNKTRVSKIKPTTNINLNSSLFNRVATNNNEPFVTRNSLLTSNQKKRPSTNLCTLSTPA